MQVINYLLGYKNYKIYQDTDMFNFSIDSVLLPNFVTLTKKCKQIMDIGCGNAPIPLILSTKTEASILGVEIQESAYSLALKTVFYNHLENQIKIVHADINELYRQLDTESFDTIVCNPPFFKLGPQARINVSSYKTIARHEVTLNVEQIFMIACKLLKNNGNIALVHRPDRLLEIMDIMRKNNIEPKRIQFVYPKKNSKCNGLLIEGTKHGKPGLQIEPPIFVHEDDGTYTSQVLNYFE